MSTLQIYILSISPLCVTSIEMHAKSQKAQIHKIYLQTSF